jgi:hypothetical protein
MQQMSDLFQIEVAQASTPIRPLAADSLRSTLWVNACRAGTHAVTCAFCWLKPYRSNPIFYSEQLPITNQKRSPPLYRPRYCFFNNRAVFRPGYFPDRRPEQSHSNHVTSAESAFLVNLITSSFRVARHPIEASLLDAANARPSVLFISTTCLRACSVLIHTKQRRTR